MSFPDQARKTVVRNGGRLTKPRELVIDLMAADSKPMNAYEIADLAKNSGRKIDVSTVYRILESFEKIGIVHFLKGEQRYVACQEIGCKNDNHCHHEFLCDDCGRVSELHIEDGGFFNQIQEKYKNLKIKNHYLELSGICNECA